MLPHLYTKVHPDARGPGMLQQRLGLAVSSPAAQRLRAALQRLLQHQVIRVQRQRVAQVVGGVLRAAAAT